MVTLGCCMEASSNREAKASERGGADNISDNRHEDDGDDGWRREDEYGKLEGE